MKNKCRIVKLSTDFSPLCFIQKLKILDFVQELVKKMSITTRFLGSSEVENEFKMILVVHGKAAKKTDVWGMKKEQFSAPCNEGAGTSF